jgi:hypothetical protein
VNKSEIRNQKSEGSRKIRNPKRKHLSIRFPFRISDFGFPSDFWFRISSFGRMFIIALCIAAPTALASDPDAPDAPEKPYRPLPSLFQWEVAGAPKDPIQTINRHLGRITGELADAKTNEPVQTQQKKAVADLDSVIKQLEDEMKQGGGSGSNPNPTKPMQKSILAGGPGGSGPLHDPKAGIKPWGDLSPKEREQIMQSQTEGFPAGYESVLSSYFNRLAQEKVNSEGNGEPATTQPSHP